MSKQKGQQAIEIKIIPLGESGVGKTNLINILMGNPFNDNEISSTTNSYSEKKVTINNKLYRLNLWDTIGQEKYRQLTKIFYKDAKIVIFVFDITSKDSFDELDKYWVKDVREQLGDDGIVKGVIANKIDLFLNEQISTEQGEEYAKKLGAKFLSISAKTEGPKKFEAFLLSLVEEYIKNNGDIIEDPKKVDLKDGNDQVKKKCC